MAEAKKEHAAAPAECLITDLVSVSKARVITKRFLKGEPTRSIARVYGLSRGGVEHLVREQCRLR